MVLLRSRVAGVLEEGLPPDPHVRLAQLDPLTPRLGDQPFTGALIRIGVGGVPQVFFLHGAVGVDALDPPAPHGVCRPVSIRSSSGPLRRSASASGSRHAHLRHGYRLTVYGTAKSTSAANRRINMPHSSGGWRGQHLRGAGRVEEEARHWEAGAGPSWMLDGDRGKVVPDAYGSTKPNTDCDTRRQEQ